MNVKIIVQRAAPLLQQKSTILGLLSAVALAIGWVVAPERMDAIATVVSSVAGLALVLIQEQPSQ